MGEAARKLIQDASSGDPLAVDRLLEMHLPALHAFVRLQAGEALTAKESCSDLVQSVCREVLEGMGDFEYRGEGAFRGWLFAAALHKILDRRRYYGRQKRDVGREQPGPEALPDDEAQELLACYGSFCTPSRDAMAREELLLVEAAFGDLEPQHQEAITLCRVAGLSYAEAAAQTGRTEGSMRGLVARGLARLARKLSRRT